MVIRSRKLRVELPDDERVAGFELLQTAEQGGALGRRS